MKVPKIGHAQLMAASLLSKVYGSSPEIKFGDNCVSNFCFRMNKSLKVV